MMGAVVMRFPWMAVAMLGTALPPTTATADLVTPYAEHCVINVAPDDVLNLRRGPGTGHPVEARLPYARCGLIVVGACQGQWCPVEDGHHGGWVHRRHIAAVSSATVCLNPEARHQYVSMRAWPDLASRVVVALEPESCGITLLPYAVDGWQKIRQGGWEGWVRLSDLQLLYD